MYSKLLRKKHRKSLDPHCYAVLCRYLWECENWRLWYWALEAFSNLNERSTCILFSVAVKQSAKTIYHIRIVFAFVLEHTIWVRLSGSGHVPHITDFSCIDFSHPCSRCQFVSKFLCFCVKLAKVNWPRLFWLRRKHDNMMKVIWSVCTHRE